MALRSAAMRLSSRRFSTGSGRVLGEEEKAAENVYIKKKEQEKLEKLARKGPGETAAASSATGPAATDATASASSSSSAGGSTQKVSTDSYRNYAVVAGVITIGASLGWYLKSRGDSKKQEVQE